MQSIAEEWRPIPGFPNYEASNLGRIRSLDRVFRRMNRWGKLAEYRWKGRIMKLTPHRGWLAVTIRGEGQTAWGVHQLIASAFHGPCPEGLVVDHVNTIKTDNRPENLEYVTNTENVKRQYAKGLLSNLGETNGKAKLTKRQVIEIRMSSEPDEVLAARYGVSVGHVFNLRSPNKKLWPEAVPA